MHETEHIEEKVILVGIETGAEEKAEQESIPEIQIRRSVLSMSWLNLQRLRAQRLRGG